MESKRTYFKHLIFAYTEKCNARCEHCCSSCGPDRTEKLSPQRVIENLAVLPTLGISSFTLSGGEPFLYFDEIREICVHAKRLNLRFNLGTNGFWAKKYTEAERILYLFKNLGLSRLLLSYDKYHQRFIQIHNIFNLVKAAAVVGVDAKITVDMTRDDEIGKEILKRFVAELKEYDCEISVKEPHWVGRAQYNVPEHTLSSYRIDDPMIDAPCHLLYYPAVNPDGGVITCCTMADILIHVGSPLYLGNINNELIDSILIRAEKNVFLHILENKGPVALKRMLESAGQNVCTKEVYHLPCELCCELLGNPETLSTLERQLYNDE